jgi:hypothetical protein
MTKMRTQNIDPAWNGSRMSAWLESNRELCGLYVENGSSPLNVLIVLVHKVGVLIGERKWESTEFKELQKARNSLMSLVASIPAARLHLEYRTKAEE